MNVFYAITMYVLLLLHQILLYYQIFYDLQLPFSQPILLLLYRYSCNYFSLWLTTLGVVCPMIPLHLLVSGGAHRSSRGSATILKSMKRWKKIYIKNKKKRVVKKVEVFFIDFFIDSSAFDSSFENVGETCKKQWMTTGHLQMKSQD